MSLGEDQKVLFKWLWPKFHICWITASLTGERLAPGVDPTSFYGGIPRFHK